MAGVGEGPLAGGGIMLKVDQVHKEFRNPGTGAVTTAFENLSFDVSEGEFLSIIGPSGCGKTTLLRCIDGLIGIDGGTVEVAGRAVSGPGPDRAVVFQSFALLPWATVARNIGFPLELRGVDKAERERRISDIVCRVGLQGVEGNYPHTLSGGMQQRVGLARALVADPTLLLLDEPFGALDAQIRRQLQDDLLALWERERKTVVMVTHDMEEAVYLSDRVLVLSRAPTSVECDITVDLPRPRGGDTRRLPRFAELVDSIWDTLKVTG